MTGIHFLAFAIAEENKAAPLDTTSSFVKTVHSRSVGTCHPLGQSPRALPFITVTDDPATASGMPIERSEGGLIPRIVHCFINVVVALFILMKYVPRGRVLTSIVFSAVLSFFCNSN